MTKASGRTHPGRHRSRSRKQLFPGQRDSAPGACAHGIYAGKIARLRIEHCEFAGQLEGHHIKSRAARTEILGNRIQDGPDGTASYLVDIPNGGSVLICGNRFEKGPNSAELCRGHRHRRRRRARLLADRIDVENNILVNDTGGPTVFVRNYTAVPARLRANTLSSDVTPLYGAGTVEPQKN